MRNGRSGNRYPLRSRIVAGASAAFFAVGCGEQPPQLQQEVAKHEIQDIMPFTYIGIGEIAVLSNVTDKDTISATEALLPEIHHVYPHGISDNSVTLSEYPQRLKGKIMQKGRRDNELLNDLACDVMKIDPDFSTTTETKIGGAVLGEGYVSIAWPEHESGAVIACFPHGVDASYVVFTTNDPR